MLVIMYLCFKLRYNLGPIPHIRYTVCYKAFKTLDFVIMLTKEFHLDMSIKIVYCTLVHHKIESSEFVSRICCNVPQSLTR